MKQEPRLLLLTSEQRNAPNRRFSPLSWAHRALRLAFDSRLQSRKPRSRWVKLPMWGATVASDASGTPNHFASVAAY